MPYKRPYKRPYKKYARKPITKKTKKLVTGHGPTLLEKIASYAGPVATLAKAVVPIVAAINTEAKYLDVGHASTTAVLATPLITNLTAMAQGLTDTTRIGNSLLCKNIHLSMRLIGQDSVAGRDIVVRVLLFVDKMQNGTPPTLAQLMEDPSSILSNRNKDYTDRFVTLHDQVVNLNYNYLGAFPRVDLKWFNNLDFHTRYLGTSAADADQGPNAIYVMYWPSTTTSGYANVGGYSRLNYTDN